MRARAWVIFHGHVQGVNFRVYCAEKAQRLGLDGFVRNLPDGTVEAVFEGDKPVVEACIEWNRTAQPHARVTSVDVDWQVPSGQFRGFEVSG